ncbi:hypothetical protein KUCAC02_014500 [Chaenocephalus aceratus]|uniref:Uncharacterized protein n=1 Tax=Chaenocephalus aceratus TaxID=36190 RepID=A0ACB9WEW2_CHAAC|nr:hypothetical protein KUCAC02_014500 [Chaenocephalus aceratus]
MDKRKKRPGGAEKLRLKKLKSLEVEAAKYSKLTDLFGAGSPDRFRAIPAGQFRERAVESDEYVSPKTGSPEREKAVESEECVSPKTGSSQSSQKYGYPS